MVSNIFLMRLFRSYIYNSSVFLGGIFYWYFLVYINILLLCIIRILKYFCVIDFIFIVIYKLCYSSIYKD